MERAVRPAFRPGPSLVAAVALSTAVLGVGTPAPPPGTDAEAPPVVSDREAPRVAGPEAVVVPRPVTRVSPGRIDTDHHPVSPGIPAGVYLAYQRAAGILATGQPGCRLPVTLLAAIGRIESGHARGGLIDARGTTVTPIIGPRLDGRDGFAAIPDTDGGRYDGDSVWDRAVGPMQFIPGTWREWAADGNDDGVADPHNVFDAALTAGDYLCAAGRDLSTEDGLRAGVLSYNASVSYLDLVLRWMAVYERGVVPELVAPADPPPPADTGDGGTDTAAAAPPAAAPPETPPATQPPPPEPGGTTENPAEPPLAAAVSETVCVVDGIVVSVLTATTGLLGQEVSAAPAGDCGPAR